MNLDDLLAEVDGIGVTPLPPSREAPPPTPVAAPMGAEPAPVAAPAPMATTSLDMVYDLELELMVELGHASLPKVRAQATLNIRLCSSITL